MNAVEQVVIEAHRTEVREWRQTARGGVRDDRMMSQVTVFLPPSLAQSHPAVPSAMGERTDNALREISALDHSHGEFLAPLAALLLRAESVASSKIEHVEASVEDYARAMHGIKSNASAMSIVASTRALDDMIRSVDGGRDFSMDAALRAHATLMADDPTETAYAGQIRDMQNWIGGSDHSPRGALYVPPPPETVQTYLSDLVAFCNRRDLNVFVQAAMAHAQFESIHPFTDGNGRIGRALINTILRRRGATQTVVVPLASALVARRESYFDALGAYRDGNAGPIISSLSRASAVAAEESRVTASRIAEMPTQWREDAGRPRAGSAAGRILDTLINEPIFSAEDAEHRVGGASSSVYAGIARLHESGVLRPLTNRTRNQVWIATSLVDELDDLGARIGNRARELW